MEVERAAPSDRPHARPVSETLMKRHIAPGNWTNIVKKKNIKDDVGAVLASCPNKRAHEATLSGEKPSVQRAQTEFIEVSFINKVMSRCSHRWLFFAVAVQNFTLN